MEQRKVFEVIDENKKSFSQLLTPCQRVFVLFNRKRRKMRHNMWLWARREERRRKSVAFSRSDWEKRGKSYECCLSVRLSNSDAKKKFSLSLSILIEVSGKIVDDRGHSFCLTLKWTLSNFFSGRCTLIPNYIIIFHNSFRLHNFFSRLSSMHVLASIKDFSSSCRSLFRKFLIATFEGSINQSRITWNYLSRSRFNVSSWMSSQNWTDWKICESFSQFSSQQSLFSARK